MSKNITKAKLKDRSLTVDFTEEKVFVNPEGETIQSAREVTCKCDDLCHDSLVYAFDQLKPHAALIADLRDAIKVENAIAEGKSIYEIDLDELASISITGFVVTGSDEDGSKGAMIIRQKKTGVGSLKR